MKKMYKKAIKLRTVRGFSVKLLLEGRRKKQDKFIITLEQKDDKNIIILRDLDNTVIIL